MHRILPLLVVVVGILTLGSTVSRAAIPSMGLVASWGFNEGSGNVLGDTAGDVADNGILYGPFWWQIIGRSHVSFDGENDYVRLQNSSDLEITGNAVTIWASLRLHTLPSELIEPFGGIFGSQTDSYDLYLDKDNAELRFKITDADGTAGRVGIPEAWLRVGEWIDVVAVYEGSSGEARIYLNGVRQGLFADADLSGVVQAGQIPAFGRNGLDEKWYFPGDLDHFGIWDRVLTASEIRNLRGAATTQILDDRGDGCCEAAFLEFEGPQAIAVDASRNVFAAGAISNNVFRITPDREISKILDSSSGLFSPEGIATDSSGNVFVSGNSSNNVFKVTPAGVVTEIVEAPDGGPEPEIIGPQGIAVHESGAVYVAGRISGNVLKITPDGTISEVFLNLATFPIDVAVDASENVFVANAGGDNVFKVTSGGVTTEIIDATGAGAGQVLEDPVAVAVDSSGNVFVIGESSNNVFKITPGGGISQIMDSTGTGFPDGGLNTPLGLTVDGEGNVYVTSQFTSSAFKITPSGSISMIIDNYGDRMGNALYAAYGIAVDDLGVVYVVGQDSDNVFRINLPLFADGFELGDTSAWGAP